MARRCGYVGLACLLFAAAGLTGCSDAVTIHSVVQRDDPVPDVPDLVGRWRVAMPGETGFIIVDGAAGQRGQCRALEVRFNDGSERYEGGDQLCLVEFNGHLIAELAAHAPTHVFYRQYLIRFHDDDRFELCSAWPVWVMFDELDDDHPVGYSLESLQYTVQERSEHSLLVMISEPRPIRDFLTTALPELASDCDSPAGNKAFGWVPFDRMTREEIEKDDAAAQEAANPAG